MKSLLSIFALAILFLSCDSKIKDSETQIVQENGTEVLDTVQNSNFNTDPSKSDNKLIGYWVGYFEQNEDNHEERKYVSADEGFYWNRENKINLSIDNVSGENISGHSVVAGNNRPFKGTLTNGKFFAKEPGDNKYDGEFTFELKENKLVGTWKAYKKIDIPKRKYTLEKKSFTYNPDILLVKEKRYIDWNNYNESKTLEEVDENEFEEWISREFASSTELIYKINASNTVLKKKDVENLKKGDLTIIRNTIYARHGYSFKHRPLRVFFDAQPWYIPVHTDIKSDFTAIEKENIKLLLRYEKNAVEYYDYFGRG